MKRSFLAVLVAVTAAYAAPVPQPPPEVLTTFKTLQEYETETVNRGGRVLRYEELNKGTRVVMEKGWYATYYTDAGWMYLSTIPDGRLRYGYFDHGRGEAIPYNGRPAPAACIGCHNKTRER